MHKSIYFKIVHILVFLLTLMEDQPPLCFISIIPKIIFCVICTVRIYYTKNFVSGSMSRSNFASFDGLKGSTDSLS